MKPLVSVVCLCYNHEKFVKEALTSVVSQSYKNVEIFIVDDCSTDKSREIMKEFILEYPRVNLLVNEKNIGNCKSFNKAFSMCKGKYIIDFATDDVMYPDRIAKQVEAFEKLDNSYGVIFTNAMNIDEQGRETGIHFKKGNKVPSGDVYRNILERYFINPPTMMIRTSVLEKLGGYDETLAYEDFDFWVRSSREYKYYYLDEVLTKRRRSSFSHSSKFYKKGYEVMAETTYRVVLKAMWLNKTEDESKALVKRIHLELRQAFYMEYFTLVEKYTALLKELRGKNFLSGLIYALSKVKMPICFFYQMYLKIKN